ncbi:CHASE2 domain-containing protein [Gloeothece verrucosa]|uniref:CHASE2 domain protein n=1 Tax=Gloeothece verrucosa (strain PCC 7822) TaxID=497965 RepID=E0UFK4_GLOV7|nr:CHASE2 domain-containing protein [Gloeothece verrucosa]ADN16698.1 CHASE2 domain protein [Gloeothece verrucosa PCC 7822]
MTPNQSKFEYQVGGSLDSQAPSYVTRQADSIFYEALVAAEFCYVLNSRQMGKSSLRVRTMQKLQAQGTICAFIDLTGMGKQEMTPEQWYAGIVQSLVSSCQLNSKIQWRTWWRERRDLLSPVQRLSLFVEEVLLVEIRENIVVFIDEIDRVLSQKFSLNDFFALIRFFLGQRNINAEYKRLTFALLGVATPNDLIQDKTQTPFNIGKAIKLQGFQLHEVQPLIKGLQGKVDNPKAVMKQILDWTGGQPFLTQKLCNLVVDESTINNFFSVEQVVRSRIIENWESQDEPEHLRTIRDRICYRNQAKLSRLLGLYQNIRDQGEIAAELSPEHLELRLSGLVVEQQGKLKVYNRIYESVFNEKWLQEKLCQLRPYGTAITAWSASNCQDESYLLQGQSLLDALAWALGKSLSDLDYQYLVASQDLAKRQAQSALHNIEKASQFLATARQKARETVKKQRIAGYWLALVAIGVTIPILLLRNSGLLQELEWGMLDQFFRWRLTEPIEKRVVVVTIDESDLKKIGTWPIPDLSLAQAITNIKAQNPQAIGLDLYRDLPVEPGHNNLIKLFQSTPNLFGIEKVVENPIAPPAILSERGQVGFSDVVIDTDRKIRRALLSVRLSDNKVRYSLALKLALNYLEAQGITEKTLDNDPYTILLGKATFKRFEANDGGYVCAQSGGYQILLNFRGSQADFLNFSLTQVLNNQIPLNSFRSRLVLLGTTAQSINDFFYTPYSSNWFNSPTPMPGVFIHANIISQIISASKDGRPLLRVWKEPLEWLWIFALAVLGAGISWWNKSSVVMAIGLLLISIGLFGLAYILFLQGWWVPVVPSSMTFLAGAIALVTIANKQLDKLLLHYTLTELLEVCREYPEAGHIAIAYLKLSESKKNQAFIDKKQTNI